ncbi:hypothetical protein [Mangrovimonas cancribranchiae]|uniref:Gliding motility lipoprotein GldD n=1 Tax=Mangrovimonas cancribranchiae TaxID=3080055 RepID=A0AAU6NV73_9FLAO
MRNKMCLFLMISLMYISCNSTKEVGSKPKQFQNYICLDSEIAKIKQLKYEINIPDTWCAYVGFHDIISYSPRPLFDLEANYYKNTVYVSAYDNDTFKSDNIEEALNKHIVDANVSSFFQPVYTSNIHDIYGKYYIVKRNGILQGVALIQLDVLFNYNNQDYIIHYSVLENNYETYINDVIKMIESFRIKQ